jgi:threonine/homoserine/homoserine lactone efflux protein
MSHSLFVAFVMFAFVMFITPGPNNIMLLSSGLTYGFRRTVPHIVGVTIGFAFMVGAVGVGLGAIFIAYPVLQSILKYVGAAYLITWPGRSAWPNRRLPNRTTAAAP